jgi:hypothetical protein
MNDTGAIDDEETMKCYAVHHSNEESTPDSPQIRLETQPGSLLTNEDAAISAEFKGRRLLCQQSLR